MSIVEPAVPTRDTIIDLINDDHEFARIIHAIAAGADPQRWIIPMRDWSDQYDTPPEEWEPAMTEWFFVSSAILGMCDENTPRLLLLLAVASGATKCDYLSPERFGLLAILTVAAPAQVPAGVFAKALSATMKDVGYGE